MKNRYIIFFFFFLIGAVLQVISVQAQENQTMITSAKVAGGIATEYVLHEAGHWLGGHVTGTNIHREPRGWSYETGTSRSKQNIITVSGFALPMITSEALLGSEIPKDDPYIATLIIAPMLHNLIYVSRDATGNLGSNYNDFETMDRAGIGREITYPLVLLIPAFQGWRLWHKRQDTKKISFNIYLVQGGATGQIGYRF